MKGKVLNRDRFLSIFAESTVDVNGCRIWAGGYDGGYARYSGEGAYRIAYRLFVGTAPDGLDVDHECFNPACVEPSHLRLLTRVANCRNKPGRPVVVPDDECINGHHYDALNTYVRPSGQRDCRACGRERVRAYKARRAVA